MIAFLDACTIIYRVEAVEPYLSRLKRALSRLHGKEQVPLVAISRLSMLECRVKPLRDADAALLAAYEDFFSAPGLRIVEMDARVVDRATLLRAELNLSTPDALQAASALSLGGEVRFVTNDSRLRRVRGIEIVVL